jgi:hypothetical protein
MDECGRSPGGDDAIRRLRQAYSERMRVEQRRDAIETRALAVFLWFFISFWSLGIYEIAFGDWHVTFRTTQGVLEVLGAAVFGLLVTLLGYRPLQDGRFDPLFPRGEPGLLEWWDERRRR